MTVRNLAAIAIVFGSTALAWLVLGASVETRTKKSRFDLALAVSNLWGGTHAQKPPEACFEWMVKTDEETVVPGSSERNAVRLPAKRSRNLILESSQVSVDLDLEHRRKGLLWYDTYTVDFSGRYVFRAPELPATKSGAVTVDFSFPSQESIYDDFEFKVNGEVATLGRDVGERISARRPLEPGEEVLVEISYRSRGFDTWSYLMTSEGVATVRAFALTMTTNFGDFDFPVNTLSPTEKTAAGKGWRLTWVFDSLVSGKQIGLDLPNRANPGPLAARITFFAPVCLLFFFTVLVMLGALGHLELHPMHYFFLAAAFFSFHLLLAYLADHLSIHACFVLAAAVSITLVVSYLRIVCGLRRALLYAGGAQLVFLVLFSYAFFFEGLTGLTITIGSILTLFVLMQLTAKVDWQVVFTPVKKPLEAPYIEAGET